MNNIDYKEELKKLIENKKDRDFFIDCIEEGVSFEDVIAFNKKQKTYKQLFVSKEIRAHEYRNLGNNLVSSFDLLNYVANKEIEKNQARKKMRSFFSRKNMDIANDQTLNLFVDLIRLNVEDEFYHSFRKKISAFDSTEKLNRALTKEVNVIKRWNYNIQEKEISSSNVRIIQNEENNLVFEVFDFNTARNLGTNMWCICRDEEDFITHRGETDRIIFKYDLTKPASSDESMTAYVTKASGDLNTGYLRDDNTMSDDQITRLLPKIPPMDSGEYMERLSGNKNNVIKIYDDNMEVVMRNNDYDFNISIEDLDYNLENNSTKYLMNKLLDNYKEFLNKDDYSNGLGVMMHRMNRLNTTNEMYQRFLNNPDYTKSDYFKSRNLIDEVSENTLFIDSESIDLFVKKKELNVEKEIGDELINKNKLYDIQLLLPVCKNANINLMNYFKEIDQEDKIEDILFRNFNLANDLFGGDKNPEKIIDIFKKSNVEYNSYFLDKLNNYAVENNIEPLKIEVSENVLKKELLKHPKKMFIKEASMLKKNIVFNYEESLSLLKTAFLDDDVPFEHYEKDYAMEDYLSAVMNEKSKDLLLNSKHVDKKAVNDFFVFLDGCKQEVSVELQEKYEKTKPNLKSNKKNKMRIK